MVLKRQKIYTNGKSKELWLIYGKKNLEKQSKINFSVLYCYKLYQYTRLVNYTQYCSLVVISHCIWYYWVKHLNVE
jgi:hypothetical protein